MQIRSKTLRWLLVLSTVVMAVIITIQLYWIEKIYVFEQKQFNTNVSKSIRGMYEDLDIANDSTYHFDERLSSADLHTYIARIDTLRDLQRISASLSREFTDFDIFTDCVLALHVAGSNVYSAYEYLDMPDAAHAGGAKPALPVFKKSESYIVLYFPNRTKYIIRQMLFWLVSGGILIFVLIAFSFSIFYLYHQTFLNETQKDFVNNFTHEFKTPLSVIRIAADVLKDPAIIRKPDKLHNYAGIIEEQTRHLQQQTERLLHIAFTDQYKLPLKKEVFDAGLLLDHAVAGLAPMIEQKQGVISITHRNANTMVEADRSYLLLSFINLIENAIKYAAKPVIEIITYVEGNDLSIEIHDNGAGIERRHQKKIFDRFYRVASGDVQNAGGFGLGLNFVKKIVDAHRGAIEVRSEYGKGSIFIIKIPRT